MVLALVLFGITYVSLMAFTKYRAYIAMVSAVLFVILGIMPVEKIFGAIEWNVIMMIGGTMGIVTLFIDSKMPALLADIIIEKVANVKWAVVGLALFAGLISAFVDNVATVLMVAPVAIAVSKKLKINPMPVIIAIAVSSNLQGAATLVGDTTSILLGGYAKMDFLDFFFYEGRPGMFWIVQIGAILSVLVLLYIFRRDTQEITESKRTEVADYFPTILLLGTIVLLIIVSFLPNKPAITNGIICVGLFAIGLIREIVFKRNYKGALKAFTEIDYTTLVLLIGLFVVIGGITEAGVIAEIAALFVRICGDNLFLSYTLIVWMSVLLSAFIDNIPYVATMLPVAASISQLIGAPPYILYFGLLVGATLGGNLTPIGASANITAIGILEKEGITVQPKDFMRIGVPFTLVAVLSGYVLVWLFWAV